MGSAPAEEQTILDQFELGESILFLLNNVVWLILLVVVVAFSFLVPRIFSSSSNLTFILYSSAGLGLLTLAESICLLSGNFDLSVSVTAMFSSIVAALFITQWFPGTSGFVGIFVLLAVGGAIGLFNGVSVAVFEINPFLQTFAVFIILRQAGPYMSPLSIGNLPASFTFLGGYSIGSIPISVIVLLLLYLVTWLFLRYTSLGVGIYAVGGDSISAEEAGIDSTRTVLFVFVLSGILSALAGLLFVGFLGSASPNMARGALFQAIAAAVIGGISLFGGRGNIINALGGVLLISTIQIGLVLVNLDATLVQMVNGIILLLAIYFYTAENRLRKKIVRS